MGIFKLVCAEKECKTCLVLANVDGHVTKDIQTATCKHFRDYPRAEIIHNPCLQSCFTLCHKSVIFVSLPCPGRNCERLMVFRKRIDHDNSHDIPLYPNVCDHSWLRSCNCIF